MDEPEQKHEAGFAGLVSTLGQTLWLSSLWPHIRWRGVLSTTADCRWVEAGQTQVEFYSSAGSSVKTHIKFTLNPVNICQRKPREREAVRFKSDSNFWEDKTGKYVKSSRSCRVAASKIQQCSVVLCCNLNSPSMTEASLNKWNIKAINLILVLSMRHIHCVHTVSALAGPYSTTSYGRSEGQDTPSKLNTCWSRFRFVPGTRQTPSVAILISWFSTREPPPSQVADANNSDSDVLGMNRLPGVEFTINWLLLLCPLLTTNTMTS